MKPQPRFSPPALALAAALIGILILIAGVKRARHQSPQPAATTALPGEPATDPANNQHAPLQTAQPVGNLPTLIDPPESPSAAQLLVRVVTANDQPVPNAKIRARIYQREHAQPRLLSRSNITDTAGTALLELPPAQDLSSVDISVSHDDYGGRSISWSKTTGDVIPASYTFKLHEGISIGGRIIDQNGSPVPDANLRFARFWTGPDPRNAPGEQPDFSSRSIWTDSGGKWALRGLSEEILHRIRFTVAHPEFVETNLTVGGGPDEAKLRAGTHLFFLIRGLPVFGRVIDQSGQPIEKAQVWAGKMNYTGTQDTTSDAQGLFRFANLKHGYLQFSVLAQGFRPEVRNVEVTPEMEELVFQLGPGAVVRGIVQDEAGERVAGVRLSLEDERAGVSQEYRFDMTSAQDGRFEWNGAPDEPKKFSILKAGYMAKRGHRLHPNQENVVTIRKAPKLQGLVLDAETGQPIPNFRAGVGRIHVGSDFYADNPGMRNFSTPDGRFELQIHEEQINAIKAEADDYSDKVEQLPQAEDGVMQIVFRLTPSAALRALLVDSRGQPIPGGTVGLTKINQPGYIRLANGRLFTVGSSTKLTTSDAQGQFTLSSLPETGGLIVGAAPAGFGSAPIDQVRAAGCLVLQEFGSIEGTIRFSGAPLQGQQFTFNFGNNTIMPDWSSYKATSDENGRFRLDHIPPGEISVVRLIPMGGGGFSHSHHTPVTVQPGQTSTVRFGEDGALIQGKFTLDYQPPKGEKLVFSARLNQKRPEPPRSFSNPSEAMPFRATPEFLERIRTSRWFAVTVEPEGAFYVDSIPPGEYTLTIEARKVGVQIWEGGPVATATSTVMIPEGISPNTPINVTDMVLRPK